MDIYKKFCKDCIQGKIGYKCDFHILQSSPTNNNNNENKNNNNEKSVDVSIVSPTRAAVDQAKSELKQGMHINEAPMPKQVQRGGSSYRGQIKSVKSRKKPTVTKTKINKTKDKTKIKIKKPKKKITRKKTYKLSWM